MSNETKNEPKSTVVGEQFEKLEQELARVRQERDDANKDAESWKHHWQMYRDAWVRELGGWTIPKAHEIDSLVLTTRKRCTKPLLGNCGTPHWLGKPTEDGKALQQTPHPRDNSCKDWKADSSEPNPRAETAERKLQEQAEAVRQLLRYCSHLISCSYSEDFPCNCGFNATAERLKALQPTPEGGTK